jgi:hypothetical protein
MHCTRCSGTGFLNLDQVDDEVLRKFDESGDHNIILDWLDQKEMLMMRLGGCACHISAPCCFCLELHDVQVCDCCGDGKADWYGTPGEHHKPSGQSGDWDSPTTPECI